MVTSSDLMAFSARNNKTFRVPADFKLNSQFYSVAKLTKLKQKSWARGGVIKDSSIRSELSKFLKESYNCRGQNNQEHTTFTVDASNNNNLTNTEKRLERKRLGYFDVSERCSPQPIKKRRADVIPIHFFLVNGSRPRQEDQGTLTDSRTTNTRFVPFRNVTATIYTPILNKSWFDKIKKVNFLADEVRRQIASLRDQQQHVKKLDTKIIDVMLTLHNTYNSMKRLSSTTGGVNDSSLSDDVSETIETNESFHQKLSSAWNNVQEGNNAFKARFSPLSTASKNVVLSKSLLDYYVPPSSSIRDAFEMMFELESVTMPLDIAGLGKRRDGVQFD